MSRRSNGWRQAARAAAFSYPELRRELDALQAGGGGALDGMPGSREARRSTEDAALRELDWRQQRRLDAVEHALSVIADFSNGPSRVKLVELCYFLPRNRCYYVEGAAMLVHVSVRQAYQWNDDFLKQVWGELKGK